MYRRINAADLARNDAIAGVNLSDLANFNVASLSFSDADFGFEAMRIGDTGEVAAYRYLCADLDGQDLKDSVHACADRQCVEFVVPNF